MYFIVCDWLVYMYLKVTGMEIEQDFLDIDIYMLYNWSKHPTYLIPR